MRRNVAELSLTSRNVTTDHFFLITWPLFIYRLIWKRKCLKILELGTAHEFTRVVDRVPASRFIADHAPVTAATRDNGESLVSH